MLWRLLRHPPAEGAFNMAVDEVLYRSAVEEGGLPTLRLYSWSRPTLSFGRLQRAAEAGDLAACRTLGVDLVRRMSGGRAVLHHAELTFCLAVPAETARGISVREAYTWIVGRIRAALQRAGVPLDAPPLSRGRRPEPHRARLRQGDGEGSPKLEERRRALPCFAVPGDHEIASGGRKLVGVAQVWSRRGFLQHGSIVRSLDRDLWIAATGATSEIELGATALDELSSKPPGLETLSDLIEDELRRAWGSPPAEASLRSWEGERVACLARAKYGSESWTLQGRTTSQ